MKFFCFLGMCHAMHPFIQFLEPFESRTKLFFYFSHRSSFAFVQFPFLFLCILMNESSFRSLKINKTRRQKVFFLCKFRKMVSFRKLLTRLFRDFFSIFFLNLFRDFMLCKSERKFCMSKSRQKQRSSFPPLFNIRNLIKYSSFERRSGKSLLKFKMKRSPVLTQV